MAADISIISKLSYLDNIGRTIYLKTQNNAVYSQ